ncbi:DUF4190 domain-containing protein [Amorphoplanes digitatis]|uniref:DUF4190 domain-containing protein n=1 Tax=Actinoplanes digitatis TaxID=1868 RepID=A0A7W7I5P8_9ACTN|nr:DUF4190 domain-containing protein [Actinoplanes digitatis]MBB4766947.1 hypothetical protein [Actinoplanes digitatis]BFE77185.1 hypothetical protein GCM10020092_104860 [Actinoplanes digitatis]GID95483.1 hypothetical protein Adi01nite_48950 [Actinoplanes digitatis]
MAHHYPPAPADFHPDGRYAADPNLGVPATPNQYAPGSYTGASRLPASAGFGQSPGSAAHWMVPTGRSWQSIAAGYVALFAIVLWFLGPVALGLGVWALSKASRDRSHGRGRAIFAVVVGVLATGMLLMLATL